MCWLGLLLLLLLQEERVPVQGRDDAQEGGLGDPAPLIPVQMLQGWAEGGVAGQQQLDGLQARQGVQSCAQAEECAWASVSTLLCMVELAVKLRQGPNFSSAAVLTLTWRGGSASRPVKVPLPSSQHVAGDDRCRCLDVIACSVAGLVGVAADSGGGSLQAPCWLNGRLPAAAASARRLHGYRGTTEPAGT